MKDNQKRLFTLGEESVPRALIKLGIPSMIGMMTSALYNLVDAFFVGKLGTAQVGAVTVAYPLSVVFLGFGLLFGFGASSYLARLLGNKQYKRADECASTALFTSLGAALAVVIFLLIFLTPLLKVLGATQSILPYAKDYAVLFIIGLTFNVFNATVNNIITSEGAAIYSMVSMLCGGIANMILDPIFIFGFDMGVKGAALATLASRLVSFTIYIVYIKSGKSNFHFALKNYRFDKEIFAEIFKIGIPMLIYQLLCSVALAITNSFAAGYGDHAVAAFGIVSRILSLNIMMIMGFLKGYQPFVGYNYGAGKYDRVRNSTRTALLWTTIFSVAVAVIMIAARTPLMHAFSHNTKVIELGGKIMIANAVTFISMGYQMTYSIMFMGLGKAKEGGMISMGRQGIFFIPIIIVLSLLIGLNGIILTQPAADICSMILVYVLVKNYRRSLPADKMLL